MTTQNVWRELHNPEASWRKKIVGDINEAFVVPRYVELFAHYFGRDRDSEYLELGSGTGDISKEVVRHHAKHFKRYVLSEHFPEGVAWLKEKGFTALELDACRVSLAAQSFDVTLSWDVMHHVPSPRAMAREMMRVARGRCLLVESNGLSIFRKLRELTPAHRRAGERSFTPRTWRGFFEGHPEFELTRFEIFPFLFPIKVPSPLLPTIIGFNRWIESAPILRWQCSSVAIYLEYRRNG